LLARYYERVKRALGAITAARFVQIETQLLLLIYIQIASSLPIVRQAQRINGELLRLSGLRNPYQGKLGIIEEGVLADLLLVDGNPLENIKLIDDPTRNFLVIMKDGTIFKNLLKVSP
jgi:hypothetical protein